jgi:prephenate dehydrogenase
MKFFNATDTRLERLTIIGVGLIGGSLARAVRQADGCGEVIGCSRSVAHLQKAVSLGVIDRFETNVAAAVEGADMVVVAVPLGAMAAVFKQMASHLLPDATVTDVGSAKSSVIQDARNNLGKHISSFVPGHPIAGTERSGVEASFAELYKDHCVILTPLEETTPVALQRVRALWEFTGAEVVEMEPQHHDMVLAATSHLPHVLAYSLVDSLMGLEEGEEIFRFAAGGFRDFTRIASSDPVMWRDICLANRDAIVEMLGKFSGDLEQLTRAIEQGDGDLILKTFSKAKQQRDQLLMKK